MPGTKTLVVVVVALLIIGAFAAFFTWEDFRVAIFMTLRNQPPSQTDELTKLRLGDDYQLLAQKAEEAAASASDNSTYNLARSNEAYAKFMLGDTKSQIEAIEIAKEQYASPTSPPAEKARAINQMLSFITTSGKDELFEAAFKEGPFASHYKPGDKIGSIASLAKESFELRANVMSQAFVMQADADPLLNASKRKVLTDRQKKDHADTLLAAMPTLKSAFEQEMARYTSGQTARITLPLAYHYWTSYFYGAAAYVYPEYLTNSREATKELFAYYDANKEVAALESQMPQYYMQYANALLLIGGEERRKEAVIYIQKTMDMISANPDSHQVYIQKMKSGSVDGILRRAVKAHTPFSEFLKQFGVVVT